MARKYIRQNLNGFVHLGPISWICYFSLFFSPFLVKKSSSRKPQVCLIWYLAWKFVGMISVRIVHIVVKFAWWYFGGIFPNFGHFFSKTTNSIDMKFSIEVLRGDLSKIPWNCGEICIIVFLRLKCPIFPAFCDEK